MFSPRTLLAIALCIPAAVLGPLVAEQSAGQDGKKGPPTYQEIAKRLGLSIDEVERLHTQRGWTRTMLSEFPPEQVDRLRRKLAQPTLQHDRASFRGLFVKNEMGIIPDAGRFTAIQHARDMGKNARPDQFAGGLPVGTVSDPDQQLLPHFAGIPNNVHGWQALGPPNVGGRTRALVVHPQNPEILYAGSASGGVWKTTNGGKSWVPLSDLLADMAVCAIVMDPINPDVLYIGTGEGFNNVDAERGGGIFKTTDGGRTWAALPVPMAQKPAFYFVNRLFLSNDGKSLAAAVGQGDFNRKVITPDAGIYISTDANHAVWNQLFNGYISCLAVDPRDNTRAIAGAMEYSPRWGDAYYTVNGGLNWTLSPQSNNWTGRVELTYARANSNVVYASVNQNGGEVWRSSDGGHTYSKMNGKTPTGEAISFLGTQGWYNNVVWAGDPTDPNLVIVGGIDLWKSTDGGNTFTNISDWTKPLSAHADHHVIVSHPQYDGKQNRVVFFGNDGGIIKAEDLATVGTDANRSQGWTRLDNRYVVTQFYGAAGHAKKGIIVGGTQDNGTHQANLSGNGATWNRVMDGDGGMCAIDQDDPTYVYGTLSRFCIYRLKNGTLDDRISGFAYDASKKLWVRRPVPYNIPDAANPYVAGDPLKANFMAPFILDPNNQQRMLAGGASLWVTNDARTPGTVTTGPAWAELKPALAGNPNYISAITVAKGDSNVIWIGHNLSDIYVTTNGLTAKPTWTRVDQALPSRAVTRITIDPANSKHVFVTFGGYSAANLWVTEDGGANWRNISARLPEAPFRGLTMHPRKANFLYLATEVGVFASDDGGKSWLPTSEGPNNCRVDELFWMDETLVAASHGRGMFRIDLSKVK